MSESNYNVAAEIAILRGDVREGFARLDERLTGLIRMDETRQRDLADLEARVSALESRRVPWPLVAAVSGAVSAAGAVVGILAL